MEVGETKTEGVKFTFPRQILLVVVVACISGAYPMLTKSAWETNVALITGMALSTLNAIVGYLALQYSIGKSDSTFMKFVMGGMGIRMAGLLGLLVLCIVVLRIQVIPLMVSAMGFYLVYLVLEILYIHLNVRAKNVREG